MTLDGDRSRAGIARTLWSRLRLVRHVLVAALMVLAALVVFKMLSAAAAAIAALVILAAACWHVRAAAGPLPPALASTNATTDRDSASRLDDVLSALIAALPEPVVVLDGEGVVLAANARALTLAPALRKGEPALFALRWPAIVDAIRRAGASGEPQRVEFSERVPIDRWYEAHVIPAAPAALEGRRLLVLAFRDLTPIRVVEEMRADFVANASHELRTPLAALSGFIDTLLGPARDDPEARQKFLQIMQEQAKRMARLIDDLLSLSRIELNAHVRPETPVDLIGIVRQVVDSLQMLARERQVEVIINAPDRLMVTGDRDELIRLFVNLLENALKYGGAGKRVEITASAAHPDDSRSAEAVVAVRDFGPGIAPEHLPRLTERFYRIDVGHSRTEGGTGLGLALVKHILNRHRGQLTIESVAGAGSTFAAHLPMPADTAAA
jgi:two-component system phosphate regulon sensor histidine kinase PhoR